MFIHFAISCLDNVVLFKRDWRLSGVVHYKSAYQRSCQPIRYSG